MKTKILLLAAVMVAGFNVNSLRAQDHLLESLGALGASLMYNTYITIGSVADAFASDVYDEETARLLMHEQVDLMNNMAKTMDDLLQSGELKDPGDVSYVREMSSCFRGLSSQASYMIEYINNEEDDGEAFQNQREKNWQVIKELLQLSD